MRQEKCHSSVTFFPLYFITIPQSFHHNNRNPGRYESCKMIENSPLWTKPAIYTGLIMIAVWITACRPSAVTTTGAAAAGTYFFRCDVHPTTMIGSFIVTATTVPTSPTTTPASGGGGGTGY
jgi:hypothetical protein